MTDLEDKIKNNDEILVNAAKELLRNHVYDIVYKVMRDLYPDKAVNVEIFSYKEYKILEKTILQKCLALE